MMSLATTTSYPKEVGTLDRKDVSLWDLPLLTIQVIKAFAGVKQRPEDLKFWYKPDR